MNLRIIAKKRENNYNIEIVLNFYYQKKQKCLFETLAF
ncbi:hypothetical protein SAMN06264346_10977 [Chryseobacterium profundimaris]|uniref:Transposase n=1 Tax=Chryseobacterium profundimaris TaxID=1387275 RepID=A0ABY1P5C8_9FLAO|nr:hypothetical protein SAMN06264346_10977 [Chryseobacterium profundimaris]